MAKATVTLPNGTQVNIEGSPEEVARIMELYSQQDGGTTRKKAKKKRTAKKKTGARRSTRQTGDSDVQVDWAGIVKIVKTCDEAENIETQILDKRSRINRVLLPIYIVHKYMGDEFGLTSGDINKVTTNLSVPVSQPNASTTLTGAASKYVIADTVRVSGVPIRYKLSRRGAKYLEGVISGADGKV